MIIFTMNLFTFFFKKRKKFIVIYIIYYEKNFKSNQNES